MALHIQQCTLESLGVLVTLSKNTFIDAFAHFNNPDDFKTYVETAFATTTIKDELNTKHTAFYLVYKEDELAGYFKLNQYDAQTDLKSSNSMELERIYVVNAFQGQQIGQWMLSEVKNKAMAAGKQFLWLGVWEENTNAIRFYRKRGFKKFGTHPFYMGKDKQTDWLMRCEL